MTTTYYLGLDVGQVNDPSAWALIERRRVRAGEAQRDRATREIPEWWEYDVRQVERLALATPYAGVVARVREVVRNPLVAGQVEVVMDATGVGRPVVELARSEAAGLRCAVSAVSIVGSGRPRERGGIWSVSKRDLVAAVAIELQAGRLRIARGVRFADELVAELLNFRVTIAAGGHETYAAATESVHDDLVMAIALAVWRARWTAARSAAGERPLL